MRKVNNGRIFITILIFLVIAFIAGLSIKKINDKKAQENRIQEQVEVNNKIIEKNYKYEKVVGNKVSKEYTGMILTSVISILNNSNSPCSIAISNIQDGYDITAGGKLAIVDTKTGNSIDFVKDNEVYNVNLNLDNNVEYEIQLNNRVIGSVIAVEDLNSVDGEELYSDIAVRLSCGLQ